MTKLEYKCIELIIEKYTDEVAGLYDDHKEIYGDNIDKMKKEIATLITEK